MPENYAHASVYRSILWENILKNTPNQERLRWLLTGEHQEVVMICLMEIDLLKAIDYD